MAIQYNPTPIARPKAATIQMPAAVVNPRIDPLFCRIAPAPKKPTPEITCAATRLDLRLLNYK